MKLLTLVTFILFASKLFGQNQLDKAKAESSVNKYMSSTTKNYKGLSFGEFFEQTDSKKIQDKLKVKDNVKYSLVHTYKIGSEKITNMYFHLDEKYNVLGKMTFNEMEQMMLNENKNSLDSIMNILVPN